jgi:RHS repeat-associated protein
MDGRKRITEAERGKMTSGSIGGTARIDQIWSLDQVGNWDNVKTDLNGNSNGTDAGELNDTRTYNTANELLTRSAPSSTQTHDAAGQMTYDGQDHNFKYDAFGRLVKVTRTAVPIGTSGIRAEYKYDGLGQRIGWHCDLNADDDVTTADPWMWFVFDDRWRIVNTYRLAYSGGNWNVDSSAKERFVHHAAGLDGKGGSSYIDAVILSDRDLTNGWSGAADGTLEARLFHLQNWRNDLCAVADGDVIARHYRYSAYGSRTEVDAGDYNRDGFTDFFDILDFNSDYSTSAARADFNNNGLVNSADSTDFVDSFNVTSDDNPHSAPRGLHAGYEHDPALEYQGALSGGGAGIYTIESYTHTRHRVYSTELGRWTRRDPLGYHDGMSLYEYCNDSPVIHTDLSGLACIDPLSLVGTMQANPLLQLKYLYALRYLQQWCSGTTGYDSEKCLKCAKSAIEFVDARINTMRPQCMSYILSRYMMYCFAGNADEGAAAGMNASVECITNTTANGCGDNSWKGLLVPNDVSGIKIESCCSQHDFCYATCGFPKSTCDQMLGLCIFSKCMAQGANWVQCLALSNAYYIGVDRGGDKPYRTAQVWGCDLTQISLTQFVHPARLASNCSGLR